jgi:hypothetical protein
MSKNCTIVFITVFLMLIVRVSAMASSHSVAVSVSCNDSFVASVIKGYLQQELRKLSDVVLVEEKEQPQVELSLVCSKSDDKVAISVMKVQHIWSERLNPNTKENDYVIGRADHYVALVSNARLAEFCSNAVTEFDATYLESLRRWENAKK